MDRQNTETTKLKLQILNTLKKMAPLNSNKIQIQNLLLLKLLHTVFLKKTLTSKSTNRLIDQSFKKFSLYSKNELSEPNYVNPATLDEIYYRTFFLNSVYELLNLPN